MYKCKRLGHQYAAPMSGKAVISALQKMFLQFVKLLYQISLQYIQSSKAHVFVFTTIETTIRLSLNSYKRAKAYTTLSNSS